MAEYMCDFVSDPIGDCGNSVTATPTGTVKGLPFYIENMGRWSQGRKYITKRSGYAAFLMIFTLDGQGTIEYRGKKYSAVKNDIFMIDCREEHCYYTSGEYWKFYYIHYNGVCAETYMDIIYEKHSFDVINMGANNICESAVSTIESLMQMPDILSRMQISSLMTRMMYETAKSEKLPKSGTSALPEWLGDVIKYIGTNYSDKIVIGDLAAKYFMSTAWFIHLFKSYTGMSPYEYITGCRINISKQMLIDTEKPIESIAFDTGFVSPSAFASQFRKITGSTPYLFRQLWKNH